MNNFAHLKSDSPFRFVFPDGRVPIKNWLIGEQANCIGADQFDRICKMVAAQCDGNPDEVTAFMRKEGFIPLRAKHVSSTSSDNPAFL